LLILGSNPYIEIHDGVSGITKRKVSHHSGFESRFCLLFALKNPPQNLTWENNAATPQHHRARNNNNNGDKKENRREATIITADQRLMNFMYVLTGCVISQ
jgi:hypothetical protein